VTRSSVQSTAEKPDRDKTEEDVEVKRSMRQGGAAAEQADNDFVDDEDEESQYDEDDDDDDSASEDGRHQQQGGTAAKATGPKPARGHKSDGTTAHPRKKVKAKRPKKNENQATLVGEASAEEPLYRPRIGNLRRNRRHFTRDPITNKLADLGDEGEEDDEGDDGDSTAAADEPGPEEGGGWA
jgi:hypothetical protein